MDGFLLKISSALLFSTANAIITRLLKEMQISPLWLNTQHSWSIFVLCMRLILINSFHNEYWCMYPAVKFLYFIKQIKIVYKSDYLCIQSINLNVWPGIHWVFSYNLCVYIYYWFHLPQTSWTFLFTSTHTTYSFYLQEISWVN